MAGYTRRNPPCLLDYDYRQETYCFVTVCTRDHSCLFGRIRDVIMCLSHASALVAESWLARPEAEPNLRLDASVVMPDHFHGADALHGINDESAIDLSAVVGQLKAMPAGAINRSSGREGEHVWQRSFYDHIVRNNADLERIREYIVNNPTRCSDDRFYR